MADEFISKHKKMAMGKGYAKGGSVKLMPSTVPALKTGMKDNPLENLKRSNGIPGMKKGGRV